VKYTCDNPGRACLERLKMRLSRPANPAFSRGGGLPGKSEECQGKIPTETGIKKKF